MDTDAILTEVCEALEDEGSHYLEMMAAAYWQHTDIPPDESALVERGAGDTRIYYFVTHAEAERMLHRGRTDN